MDKNAVRISSRFTSDKIPELQISQTGCDTYMEIVTLAPDSDCNKPCVADATEFCGNGNRLAVYQDTSATPPDPQTCLTNFQLALITLFLQWVPTPGGGAPTSLSGFTITGNGSVVSLTEFRQVVALLVRLIQGLDLNHLTLTRLFEISYRITQMET